jgi:hypothetical protein
VKTETLDGKRVSRFNRTEFARLLMKHDPFIEDEGSLWFIHYELATNLAQSTTWSWFFNRFGVRHFTQDMFLAHLQRFVDAEGKRKISARSLEKDFRCFVRTYARTSDRAGHLSPEENFDCPLSRLNLLEHLPRTKSYRTLTPDEGGLPDLVVAYALARMRSRMPLMTNEISFRDALYAEGGPGRVFNLDSEILFGYLVRLDEDESKVLNFSRTAGLNLITLNRGDPSKLMELYYSTAGRESGSI